MPMSGKSLSAKIQAIPPYSLNVDAYKITSITKIGESGVLVEIKLCAPSVKSDVELIMAACNMLKGYTPHKILIV